MNIVAVLNGSTVTQFVDNKDAFDNCVDEYFQVLDVGHNGKLSRNVFRQSQFGALMREIMLAMARGIGNSLVLMALEQDSLLRKAVEHESASKK
ncbi:uncharacterized protein LOC116133843 [Pistacia vera]|uniref:uncharacterized protein LOC116133843 n=1 Tax=Pistacia vera TaxID=55513 RepID=UPI001262C72C|nr:uncharacterized protein LOC116133843 [Pistacia vera]